ncbi:MAG: SHOCT domain-containing protein [bacterium]
MEAVAWLAMWQAGRPWGPTDGWRHMDGWGPMGGGGWAWLWGVLILIGIVALVVLAVLAVMRGVSSKGASTSRAREILEERYARGELDTDEYHERLRELS